MNKPKFLMMIATAGLALSLSAHAQEQDLSAQPAVQNQHVNAALEGAKNLFGNAFSFGKAAVSGVVNSQPAQQVKGVASDVYNSEAGQQVRGAATDVYRSLPVQQVKGVASDVYHSEAGQQVRGVARNVYNSEPAQHIRETTSNVYSAGKETLKNTGHALTNHKQDALTERGLSEQSNTEQKQAAYGEANAQAAKNFFGGLFNKTKELTTSATESVQNAVQPNDPIADIANSERVKNTIVPTSSIHQNMENMRNKSLKNTSNKLTY